MNLAPIAMLALLPMISGPLPEDQRTLTLGLCSGGEITIPLSDDEEPGSKRDCHQQGCHAGNCREKSKKPGRSQI